MTEVFFGTAAIVVAIASLAHGPRPPRPRKQLEAVPTHCYVVHVAPRNECAVHGRAFITDCEYNREALGP